MPRVLNRNACLTCRDRKLKCDEVVPVCRNCQRKDRLCRHRHRVIWVNEHSPEHATTGVEPQDDHPSQYVQAPPTNADHAVLAHSPPREALQHTAIATLLALYTTTLAPWYDLNDSHAHFANVVPLRALDNSILFKAVVAFAASYKSKFSNDAIWWDLSAAFHGAFVAELVPLLQGSIGGLDKGEVLAATCLLRSYEILNGDTRSRQDHLLGAYSFAVQEPVDFLRPNLLQAGFWNYLREDITVALECRRPLHIDMDAAPEFSLSRDELTGHVHDDAWVSNAISYLLAKITNIVFGAGTLQNTHSVDRISVEVEDWKNMLPDSFQPVSTAPVADNVFPSIWLLNPWQVAGLQYYHVAMILLHMARTSTQRPDARTLTSCNYHAEQVCGMAITNSSIPARVNVFGPLAYCGRFLLNKSHQADIVKRLHEFASETGWNVHNIVSDLQQCWSSSVLAS